MWNTNGTRLRVSRLRSSLARALPASATTVSSRDSDASDPTHSWRNSVTVRWNSSSAVRHGLRT